MLRALPMAAALFCPCSTLVMAAPSPVPPPPPISGAPVTDALRALGGEWRLISIDAKPVTRPDVLTVWALAFSFGAGCRVATGQLRDIGGGRFAVERYGMPPAKCTRLVPPPPFAGAQIRVTLLGGASLKVEAYGQKWLFAKVDVNATIARDDFVRGAWLLADADGQPYSGDQLTRITFDDSGYGVAAPHCSYQENGWITDREWIVRPGGDQVVQSRKCRAATPGDKLARQGSNVRFTAEPVETRMRVRIGVLGATLVPAARFPELAAGVAAIAPDPWVSQLVEARLAIKDDGQMLAYALRAVGLWDVPSEQTTEGSADVRRRAFAGLTRWQYLAAVKQDPLSRGDQPPLGLRQLLASALIAVIASFEGIVPVDRGDGLALDYHYRVEERWRGDREPGDLVIVRMPPIADKSRSPLITPEPRARVLLLASRTGYLFGRLVEGKPPSIDRRVVAMTLPLMRVRDGKLVEAMAGANILGAGAFAGTPLVEARALARDVEAAIIGGKRSPENCRRYFVTRIGTRRLPDPTLLWFDFDHNLKIANRARLGGATRYIANCSEVVRAGEWWSGLDVGCPPSKVDPDDQRLLVRSVGWVEANGLSEGTITVGGDAGPYAPILVSPPEAEIELRPVLR